MRKDTNPQPEKYEVTNTLLEARSLEDGTKDVRIAGRIVFLRKMGKLSFFRLRDLEADIQVQLKADVTNPEDYEFFKKLVDLGDFLGVDGEIITTQTGEKTLLASSLKFLGKALKPLPEKFHGLNDTELKYRQRYVDLISMSTVFLFDDSKYLLITIICGILQFLLVIISSFMIIYRHDKKGVHDLVSGTQVIKEGQCMK